MVRRGRYHWFDLRWRR